MIGHLSIVKVKIVLIGINQEFFYVVPSSEETSFWPPSMVYISVISYTYYTLQITLMLDLILVQLVSATNGQP